MEILNTIDGPGAGLDPGHIRKRVFFRVAVSATEVVCMDFAQDDADTANNTPGSLDATTGLPNTGFTNAVNPPGTPSQIAHGIFGVAEADQAADSWGYVTLVGVVDVQQHDNNTGSGSTAAGDRLVIDDSDVNSLTFVAPSATVNKKVLGIALEAVATPATPTSGSVWFNGITGWGSLFTETP